MNQIYLNEKGAMMTENTTINATLFVAYLVLGEAGQVIEKKMVARQVTLKTLVPKIGDGVSVVLTNPETNVGQLISDPEFLVTDQDTLYLTTDQDNATQ
jgi:predicted nucleic acid-binding protein